MSEPFIGSEMDEELESTEELSHETRELNEITNEPESYIEGKIDVAQSEAIESSFNELVNAATEQSPAGADEGKGLPVPIPDGSKENASSTVEPVDSLVDTIPLPIPDGSRESVSSTAEPAEDLAGNIPLPLPGGSAETVGAGEDASINPGPLFNEAGDASIDPDPIVREAGEVGEERESLLKESEEPAPLNSLDGLQALNLQQQITQNTRDFTIVSVIMHSSGDTAKNSINNIR
jgi:hypothetical protein